MSGILKTYIRRSGTFLSSLLRGDGRKWFVACSVLLLLASCNYTDYETGDGELSYMRADYADIVVEQGRVVSILTDDNVNLTVPESFSYSEKKDTMLRRLLYYKQGGSGEAIQLVGQKNVNVIIPLMWKGQEGAPTDPLTLTAVWMSANNHYLNMQVGIKVGSSETEAVQSIMLRCDSVSTYGSGAMWLTLCHDQGNMPQYYTRELLFSIPANVLPDTVNLKVNTYSGVTIHKIIGGF